MAERSASRLWQQPHRPRFVSGPILSVGLTIIAIAAAGTWLWILGEKNRIPTNPETLCATDRPPTEVLVLLLDMSDEFTERQRLKISNDLSRLQNDIPKFGLIDVYAIDGSADRVIQPVLKLCNPGSGEELNEIYQNPGLARKHWEDFSRRLNTEIVRLMSGPGATRSPIMEAIQATALRTFNLSRHDRLKKRLVIVSDLLHYVPGRLSHYESIPSFESIKKTPYYSEVRADLSDVDVMILYLVRTRTPQPWPAHRLFWEEYFQSQGAQVRAIEPVFGAN